MNQIVTHLVLTIVMCLMSSIALSQGTTEHFKFMGIPINGTYENFVQKLKLKGFKQFRDLEVYKGVYDNDTVLVTIGDNKELNLVYCVQIIKINDIVLNENKFILYSRFEDIVGRLEIKYDIESEELSGKHQKFIPIVKNNELLGDIIIEIRESGDYSSLCISYFDVVNYKKNIIQRDKDL